MFSVFRSWNLTFSFSLLARSKANIAFTYHFVLQTSMMWLAESIPPNVIVLANIAIGVYATEKGMIASFCLLNWSLLGLFYTFAHIDQKNSYFLVVI